MSRTVYAVVPLLAALAAPTARGFEFFDGRLEVHGYYEAQLRGIARNMEGSDDWDLTQWYNVFNVEIEADVAPDGFGPFDLVSTFVRFEVRYDCVWRKACGLFNSVDVYGDDANHLPKRYSDARGYGLTGAVDTGDIRNKHTIPVDQLAFADKFLRVGDRRQPAYLWHFPGVDTLFGVPGSDGVVGTADDPAFFVFERFVRPGNEYRFGLRRVKGANDGHDLQALVWRPKDEVDPIGTLADRPNPFNPLDFNPIAGADGSFGTTAMPYRPAPLIPASFDAARRAEPRGLFYPNERIAGLLDRHEFDETDQNFTESELAWNHGASQQDERELKEAYVDLEMFDSRLWLRLGKQQIVWGKTELFRTTDQFNPQDLALSSLPSLEESRIALWSARGVWSFFEVGPLEDARLELALNFDQFEPTDLGRCGEPYTPFPVCDKTTGLFAHGLAGFGLAGEIRPPDPWESVKGLEYGARFEARWGRFSFQLSDFYGYEDFPYLDQAFVYSRNVDPRTGRPRRGQSDGGCDPDGLIDGDTSGCLSGGTDALYHHHANVQRFAVICAASVGFSDLDTSACAQSVFNSNKSALTSAPDADPSIAAVLGTVLSGSSLGRSLVLAQFIPGAGTFPTVRLNADPNDGAGQGIFAANALGPVLTDQQEALLGCGPFWGTTCDDSKSTAYGGVDLLNADLSVLAQSWPGVPGTFGDWDMRDTTFPQPGTVGFFGSPPATFFQDGQLYTLPGAHGPFLTDGSPDPSYDPLVDGCVRNDVPGCGAATTLVQPFTGAVFQSEMAAVSWNFLLTLTVLSGLGKNPASPACPPGTPSAAAADCFTIEEFLPAEPFRTDGCSYAKPQLCSNVQALYAVAHTTRKSIRAGGNGTYGRLDFDWHVAGSGVLRYEKRNVLGFAMDFAEDTTKSNWGVEATWIEGLPYEDHDARDNLTKVDTYNLTVSVDRPTFINFLNPNRTFFINSQWFFQWVEGYRDSFPSNGPLNVLATLRVETGYHRDRLNPGITLVYDFMSASGAILPEIGYRFTENLSATFFVSWFFGHSQAVVPPLSTVGDPPFRTGRRRNYDFVDEGVSPIRDRDEVALILRYTF
jgi:hypothetical protein